MKGLITIVSNGQIRVSHPLLHHAGPRSAGVRILQWLTANQGKMETFAEKIQNVNLIAPHDVHPVELGTLEFTDAGVHILPILMYVPGPINLIDASKMAKEDPVHCVIYKIDLDNGTFATYRNALVPELPAACWTIGRGIHYMSKNHAPMCADGANFRFTGLPSTERYLSFWPAKAPLVLDV